MRVNVYGEELTDEVEIIKQRDDRDRVMYGVRFYLDSPESLHREPGEDDRSAVTFWVPWSQATKHQVNLVHSMLLKALNKIEVLQEQLDEKEAFS